MEIYRIQYPNGEDFGRRSHFTALDAFVEMAGIMRSHSGTFRVVLRTLTSSGYFQDRLVSQETARAYGPIVASGWHANRPAEAPEPELIDIAGPDGFWELYSVAEGEAQVILSDPNDGTSVDLTMDRATLSQYIADLEALRDSIDERDGTDW